MVDEALTAEADTLPGAAHAAMPPPQCIGDAGLGQIVLVLQGGGALGAYQAGVFQALSEGGVVPDWVIGTSIGSINAALIAGNAPEDRLNRLNAFWSRIRHDPIMQMFGMMPMWGASATTTLTVMRGIKGFFEPSTAAIWGSDTLVGPEQASYYSVEPLRRTLNELVDFDRLNDGAMRLTVGAANVGTGDMRYFDTARERIEVGHVLASCALPPAFPAVRIDGELFWDGGVLSNTPVEAVFDDNPRRSGLIFAVHIWNPAGAEPDSIAKVVTREKDLRYSSRAITHIARQKQLHKLRHIIGEMARALPAAALDDPAIQAMAAYGCVTRMHVVRLLAPPLKGEDHSKDIDFSPTGITTRWQSGYRDTVRMLEQRPWTHDVDAMEGMILHELVEGAVIAEG